MLNEWSYPLSPDHQLTRLVMRILQVPRKEERKGGHSVPGAGGPRSLISRNPKEAADSGQAITQKWIWEEGLLHSVGKILQHQPDTQRPGDPRTAPRAGGSDGA